MEFRDSHTTSPSGNVILSEAKNPATSTDFELDSPGLLCNILAAKSAPVMIEVAGCFAPLNMTEPLIEMSGRTGK
jgi:hypothetical protein